MPSKLKNDIIAGFSVFLLALPLCLGIAIASGFPPIAGIMSAVVGGLIASFFGSAKLSIKGPAAGLIVVMLGAVMELGHGDLQLGYERTLAVGVIAALIQIGIGLWQKAVIAEVMPVFVMRGMLAAVSVIIVAKQSYVMMGVTPSAGSSLELLLKLPSEIINSNPLILMLGMIALVIALGWPLLKKLNFIPSTFVILLTIIPLSLVFNLNAEHSYVFMSTEYHLGPNFLIDLPRNIMHAITFPDFSVITSFTSIKYILMLALIGSIESLLTVCAIDTITSQPAGSDLNQDLRAVGVGNLVSSLVGGLPMISEIVRSKANIDYGATTIRANFFHGLFMLIAVVALVDIINLVPASALAAILVAIGLRLAAPQQFIHAYKVGKEQFGLFITTFLVTLATNLLIGVLAGILLKLAMHMANGHSIKQIFSPRITTKILHNIAYITIDGPLTFLGYLKLKKVIVKVHHKSEGVVVSLHAVTYLDHTACKKLQMLPHEFKNLKISHEV